MNTGVTFAIFRGSRNIPVCRNKSKTYLEYHLTLQNKFWSNSKIFYWRLYFCSFIGRKRRPSIGLFLEIFQVRWCWLFSKSFQNHSQPTFQRWINVALMLWINVEITFIRRWKWNKIRRRIFKVAERWYDVSARRWNNVETTLHNVETTLHNVCTTLIQRCFTPASTLVKTILNPIRLVMLTDLQIHE